jgi:hypothetical protein
VFTRALHWSLSRARSIQYRKHTNNKNMYCTRYLKKKSNGNFYKETRNIKKIFFRTEFENSGAMAPVFVYPWQ